MLFFTNLWSLYFKQFWKKLINPNFQRPRLIFYMAIWSLHNLTEIWSNVHKAGSGVNKVKTAHNKALSQINQLFSNVQRSGIRLVTQFAPHTIIVICFTKSGRLLRIGDLLNIHCFESLSNPYSVHERNMQKNPKNDPVPFQCTKRPNFA